MNTAEKLQDLYERRNQALRKGRPGYAAYLSARMAKIVRGLVLSAGAPMNQQVHRKEVVNGSRSDRV